VALVAHLRDDAGGAGGLGQGAGLVQRVRERLLRVDVLAGVDRRHRDDGVRVVGRADGYGVDVVGLLVEHLAEILVAAGVGVIGEGLLAAFLVDVAQGDDVALEPCKLGDLCPAHPAAADAREVELSAGRRVPGPAERRARDDREAHGRRCCRRAAGGQEVAAGRLGGLPLLVVLETSTVAVVRHG
jgi:hypothetical protein